MLRRAAQLAITVFCVAVSSLVVYQPAQAATTRYFSYTQGSDSNDCLTTLTPCKHLPGMKGLNPDGTSSGDACAGNCASITPVAGDKFILLGGDVWPYTTAPWLWTWSGTSSATTYGCNGSGCIYIGNAVGAGLAAWNLGTVTSIALLHDHGGWNPAAPPTVSCSGGGGTGAAATAYVVPSASTDPNIPGFIYHVGITNRGSGYTSAPTCTVSGGSGVTTLATDIDRFIIDLGAKEASPPDWPSGNCTGFPNTCKPAPYFSGAYVRISGIEVRNEQMQADATNVSFVAFLQLSGRNSTITDFYTHGMYVDCVTAGSCSILSETKLMAVNLTQPYDELSYGVIENGDAAFLGTPTLAANNICANGRMCTVTDFGIATGSQGTGPTSVHHNSIYSNTWQYKPQTPTPGSDPHLFYNNDLWLVLGSSVASNHLNARYIPGAGNGNSFKVVAYNNLVHDQMTGTSSQLQCVPGISYTFFNEAIYNIGSGTQGISLDMADVGGLGGCSLTIYNETIYSPLGTGVCVNTQNAANSTTITMQNLQCVSTTALNPFWSTATNNVFKNYAGSTVTANVQAASVSQSYATACTSQGYCPANSFAPTSGTGDTVTFASGSGTVNLSSIATGYLAPLTNDINGNVRPANWQAGAYTYGASPTTHNFTVTSAQGTPSLVSPTGASCGANCWAIAVGSTVVVRVGGITAGYVITGWTGCDSVSTTTVANDTCTLNALNSDTAVTVNYTAAPNCTLTATPATAQYGDTITIGGTCVNTTAVSVSNSNVLNPSASCSGGNISGTAIANVIGNSVVLVATVTGAGGSGNCSASGIKVNTRMVSVAY